MMVKSLSFFMFISMHYFVRRVLSNQDFQSLPTNSSIDFQIEFETDSNTYINSFQLQFNPFREAILQLRSGLNQTSSSHEILDPVLKIFIYEFAFIEEAQIQLKCAQKGEEMNEQNLVGILQNSHPIDHARFINKYYYIVVSKRESSPSNKNNTNDDDSKNNGTRILNILSSETYRNPNLSKRQLDTLGEDFNHPQLPSTPSPSLCILRIKFLGETDRCTNNGMLNIESDTCECSKNKMGKFCEYDLVHVTSYYSFEVLLKPFDGKYLEIYKSSTDSALLLEVGQQQDFQNIYFYSTDSQNLIPSHHFFSQYIIFNSTTHSNQIELDPYSQYMIFFIRNPSATQLYFQLAVSPLSSLDDSNTTIFIIASLLTTLFLSLFCIYCVNKLSNVPLSFVLFNLLEIIIPFFYLKKKGNSTHAELQESQDESNKEKQGIKDNQVQNAVSQQPQTNRNLMDEIMTQREIQIKSEMDQITKGDKYEQFQLENSFKEQICAICLDDFEYNDQVRRTKCNHMFHEKCLYKWLFKYISCPMCNQDIT